MELVNAKNSSIRKCAFCKHWYDPTNQAIAPKSSAAGFWEYDPRQKKKCLVRNMETESFYGCNRFECKLA
ncbi:hypothetical protein [uncultured Selenomonas sp.]|uniref:hypothetical protein n=1 Tax=uncultured Selenomonas sp. TaxID=159275 RepID=UPI0025E198A1|nr:hypothetical protein [uncultured Selenomonas sp.]